MQGRFGGIVKIGHYTIWTMICRKGMLIEGFPWADAIKCFKIFYKMGLIKESRVQV